MKTKERGGRLYKLNLLWVTICIGWRSLSTCTAFNHPLGASSCSLSHYIHIDACMYVNNTTRKLCISKYL